MQLSPGDQQHVNVAKDAGIAALVATNGMMIDLTGETPKVVERIEAGRIYLDGNVLIGAMDGVVRDRIRLALNGHVTVTLIVDEDGVIRYRHVHTLGISFQSADQLGEALAALPAR